MDCYRWTNLRKFIIKQISLKQGQKEMNFLKEFRAHDQSHNRSTEIYAELEKISKELLEHGHKYDSSWITRPINEDETVASVLCGHSERIAIAWNFVANPGVSLMQISKNLRVCGDCRRRLF